MEERQQFINSKIVELVLESVMKFYPQSVSSEEIVGQFMKCTLAVDDIFVKKIWDILVFLGKGNVWVCVVFKKRTKPFFFFFLLN